MTQNGAVTTVECFLGIDLGTTRTKVGLIGIDASVVVEERARCLEEHGRTDPPPGDLEERQVQARIARRTSCWRSTTPGDRCFASGSMPAL